MRAALTALCFSLVFVGSVLNQLPIRRWSAIVGRFDRYTFLPFWAFFAPNPDSAGLHLVFRDWNSTEWTAWEELKLPGSNGWRWLWNPGRYERKALHDLLNGLARAAAEFQGRTVLELTSCHLGLVAWVVAQPPLEAGSRCRQFAVIQAVGHGPAREIRPVVLSRKLALA